MFVDLINNQAIFYYGGAFVVFSIMVLAHEMGHFIMAKLFGIRVLEFSLGFGPKLLLWKKNNTDYVWRLIPLGGSVCMAGEDDGTSASLERDNFQNKSFFARILTIGAGPFMNYILAFMLYFFFFNHSFPILDSFIKSINEIVFCTNTLLFSFGKMFTGELSPEFTGPIGIITIMKNVGLHGGIYQFIRFAALLNICIGFFNLLPIPALDGMRIVFLVIGSIRRETVNQRMEGAIHYIGFVLLILFMFVVSYCDIRRLWS